MTSLDYPRQLRLLTAGDFQFVFDRAVIKVADPSILILARPNQLGHARIGFVISKKNVRQAVKRNRVRRIMRESFRLNQQAVPAVDMIILARPGLGELSSAQLHRLANKCWTRLIKRARQQQQNKPNTA